MRRNRGFTLIEVVGAMTAFIIAFLAGTAAVTKLLHLQTANYYRTLAGIAAIQWMKTGDETATNSYCDALTNIPSGVYPRLFCKTEHVTGVATIDTQGVTFWYGNSSPNPPATYQEASVFLGRYHRRQTP